MRGFPDLPPLWWLGSIALIHGVAWLAPGLHFPGAFFDTLSWIVLLAALGIIGWSGLWFWKKKTPIEPHHVPRTLIVEGPYRLSRNPIYLALVMLTLGSALGQGSILGVLIAGGLWAILDRRFAAVEEALLLREFGQEAKDYLAKTRRWL